MVPFCNLFMERPSYLIFLVNFSEVIRETFCHQCCKFQHFYLSEQCNVQVALKDRHFFRFHRAHIADKYCYGMTVCVMHVCVQQANAYLQAHVEAHDRRAQVQCDAEACRRGWHICSWCDLHQWQINDGVVCFRKDKND